MMIATPMDARKQTSIVLLVDDDPDALTVLTEAIEQAGKTVLVARDGATAIGLVDRIVPDVILMDAVMPGLDGFETCRRLKADPKLVHTPIIFMTGLSDTEHIVEGLEAGGVDYITKPVDHGALIARISVHLANARIIAEARHALDVAERMVIAFAPDGSVQWATPRAETTASSLIDGSLGAAERQVLVDWVARLARAPVSSAPLLELAAPEGTLTLTYLGRAGSGAFLVRVAAGQGEPPAVRLSRSLGLTPREGEVVYWLSGGKSNRDIAAILGLSTRTVNKHLEQVYAKLGVENRASAVGLALRALET